MESVTHTKDRMANKEEMRRKLQEMRLKYDKMQRKLLKSERRKRARNHVRKVIAEQTIATSPHLLCNKLPDKCEETTSPVKEAIHDFVKDEEPSKYVGREGRKQMLQRSISFKLEETVRENEVEQRDCGKETHTSERRVGPPKIRMDLTSCLKRENLSQSQNFRKDEKKQKTLKKSRLSDCRTSNSKNTREEHLNSSDIDELSESYIDQMSVAQKPTIKQDGPFVKSLDFVKPHNRNSAKQESRYGSEISDDQINRVRLKWRGTFKKQDLSWNGVCLHQLESSLLLALYHSQLAVLWMYTDQWEAIQQWQPEEGKNFTEVKLGGEDCNKVTVLFAMTDGKTNTLSLLKYNLESGAKEAEDVSLPDSLRVAEELKTVLHRGDGGVVMKKTSSLLSDFFFFHCVQPSKMWQPERLMRVSAVSFIPVRGAPNLFLILALNTLSLWMPTHSKPLIEVPLNKLPDVKVDEILWADTGGGILFFIGLKHTSALSLYALNPVTAMLLKVHTFLQPCAYDSHRVMDTSISGHFLVAMYSTKKLLIWDIYSGQALAEMSPQHGEIHQLSGITNFLVLNGKDADLFEYTTEH